MAIPVLVREFTLRGEFRGLSSKETNNPRNPYCNPNCPHVNLRTMSFDPPSMAFSNNNSRNSKIVPDGFKAFDPAL